MITSIFQAFWQNKKKIYLSDAEYKSLKSILQSYIAIKSQAYSVYENEVLKDEINEAIIILDQI